MSTGDQQAAALVDQVTARQLREIQSAMLEQLKILTSEESMERGKTLVIQQALMIHAIDRLSEKMEAAGDRLELAVTRINAAFWGLMKVPVACVLIVSASWAYLYSRVISENTWLIMMAVAAFPWLGDSITAIAKIFGLSRGNNNAREKR
jgi:hypothetical protein